MQQRLFGKGAPAPVEAFKTRGADFVVADNLDELVAKMNALTDEAAARRERHSPPNRTPATYSWPTRTVKTPRSKASATRGSSSPTGSAVPPHRTASSIRTAGPLIGVKLHILTRKTLGGIQTDLSSRALGLDGEAIGGLYAAGEVAGFGGGGVHGYNALEGTFLGGCIFSGRAAGRAIADAL